MFRKLPLYGLETYSTDKISQAQELIMQSRPELVEDRSVYEAILQFYSDNALIETAIEDLSTLLESSVIEVYKVNAESFKECALKLLDEFPELASSKGMLRYYESTPNFNWQECEKAEIAFGDALSQDNYGWAPDVWTLFQKESDVCDICRLTIVVAK